MSKIAKINQTSSLCAGDLLFPRSGVPKSAQKLPKREANCPKMVPLGAKSGPKVSQSGAQREVWEHISKKTPKMWFWRDSGLHFGPKCSTNVAKNGLKSVPKNDIKKRGLPAPFLTIKVSKMGAFSS